MRVWAPIDEDIIQKVDTELTVKLVSVVNRAFVADVLSHDFDVAFVAIVCFFPDIPARKHFLIMALIAAQCIFKRYRIYVVTTNPWIPTMT